MKITIVRHGDPDYEHDSLTEKGFKQAELLAGELAKRHFDEIYLSPLGRAQKTAEPYINKEKREAVTLSWLQESPWAWDREPESWTKNPLCYDTEKWWDAPEMDVSPENKEIFRNVENSFYDFLKERGYEREGNCFKTNKGKNEQSILFVCHLGLGSFLLSRLIRVSPALMWHNFFMPTSSITTVQTEEMIPGHASFRIREFGALPHLENHPELLSEKGAFRESAESEGRFERLENQSKKHYWDKFFERVD